MNVKSQGKIILACMGINEGGERCRNEVKEHVVKATGNLKCEAPSGVEVITAQMLKCSEAVGDKMYLVRKLSWVKEELLGDCPNLLFQFTKEKKTKEHVVIKERSVCQVWLAKCMVRF